MTAELWCLAALLGVSASFLLMLAIEHPRRDGYVDLDKINPIDEWEREPVSHRGVFARYIDRTSNDGEA